MDHWKTTPELGARFCFDLLVTHAHSAIACGSGHLPVFGTPALIASLEEASMRCVEPYLEEGFDTVGTHVTVDHIKATKIGDTVSISAELVKMEGRSLTFKVFAEDAGGLLAQGNHQRFIVNVDRFMNKV